MAREKSSLEVEPDFNHTKIRLEQRPLVGWIVPAGAAVALCALIVVLSRPGGGALPPGWGFLMNLIVPSSQACLVFAAAALTWKRTATFSIGRHQVGIDAWTGRLARPAHLALPLTGLHLEHHASFILKSLTEKRKMYRLTLQSPGGEAHRIGALACTDQDLQTLTAAIRQAQERSLPDAGTAHDVPDPLRAAMGAAGKQEA